jgi:hypothetical protein
MDPGEPRETAGSPLPPGEGPPLVERLIEHVLTAYHRETRHGGSVSVGDNLLDGPLVRAARQAFAAADRLPPDAEVLAVVRTGATRLVGEGYHVMALAEPAGRFVVKYAKHRDGVPPMAWPEQLPPCDEWAVDHGAEPDGRLHPAVWQHIRAFEVYGRLTLPNRVYLADSTVARLTEDEQRRLARFRAMGVVRSLGAESVLLRPRYPADFPAWKRPPGGVVEVGILIVQPMVTPLVELLERTLCAGDVDAVREWERRYVDFVHHLWRHGVSHLDFSILNIGVAHSADADHLVIFDPHLGVIEVSPAGVEVCDPVARRPQEQRGLDELLQAARDGSRWALWRIQEMAAASTDLPPEAATAVEEVVREFHVASGEVDGAGIFSRASFRRLWRTGGGYRTNPVARAQLGELVRHPLYALLAAALEAADPPLAYRRCLEVRGMADQAPLPQFRAALRVYEARPLLVVENLSRDTARLVKHWGRVVLPPELDIQDDPAIDYHLRDLLTGELFVRAGHDLARRGLLVGLAPYEVHVLQVEDVEVTDLVVERALADDPDLTDLLPLCASPLAVVGDVHGQKAALREVLQALGVVDSSGQWFAGPATLVLTGDLGHGPDLEETFGYVRRLAGQAHHLGGRIVWILGNHDLFADVDGGQGGQRSAGYRLWPMIRAMALDPQRCPGLVVNAAFHALGKVFAHGGVLPWLVDVAARETGSVDPQAVVDHLNAVFRQTLSATPRLHTADQPHPMFRIGTAHTGTPRLPGEAGYQPAGIFTADLRELDHHRFRHQLLPQIVGHTASHNGCIRYSPRSRLRRDHIGVDVGRQTGRGNGGLLHTDLGWMAVVPGEGARLIEASPMFVELVHQAHDLHPTRDGLRELLTPHLRSLRERERPTIAQRWAKVGTAVDPDDRTLLERFLSRVQESRRCVLVTDLDDTLTAFFGGDLDRDTLRAVAGYLRAGGALVFNTGAPFDWFYARVLHPLLAEPAPEHGLLARVALVLAGGQDLYLPDDGAFRLLSHRSGRHKAEGLTDLIRHTRGGESPAWRDLNTAEMMYLGDSYQLDGIDHPMAGRVELVVNVGPPMTGMPGAFVNARRGHRFTIDLLELAAHALRDAGADTTTETPVPPGDRDAPWTFARKWFPHGRRVHVHVGASGYVHAGVTGPGGAWQRVYEVPLVPAQQGEYQAVLPPDVDVSTFFWTEPPHTPGHPGHWERQASGGRVFHAEPAHTPEGEVTAGRRGNRSATGGAAG